MEYEKNLATCTIPDACTPIYTFPRSQQAGKSYACWFLKNYRRNNKQIPVLLRFANKPGIFCTAL